MSSIKIFEGDYIYNYITGSCHEEQVLAGESEGNCWRVSRLTASRQKLGFFPPKGGSFPAILVPKVTFFSGSKGPVSHIWSVLRKTNKFLCFANTFSP